MSAARSIQPYNRVDLFGFADELAVCSIHKGYDANRINRTNPNKALKESTTVLLPMLVVPKAPWRPWMGPDTMIRHKELAR